MDTDRKRTRRITAKTAAAILAMTVLVQSIFIQSAAAAVNAPQPAPERLRMEAIYDQGPSAEPAIGYNEFDKYYIDLKTDRIRRPDGVTAPSIYMNYYLQEINKPYKPVRPSVLKEGSIPARTDDDNEIRLKELNSGTIYYAHAKAYYTYTLDTVTYTSTESSPSNTVKFMTDIDIKAYSYGPNQIKIEWDDVWNTGRRMDYKLYVSESKSFTNSPPIYIGQAQISQNGPVTVNEASGKLEYIHTVRDPGRVYYIKIEPDTTETELKRSPSSPVVVVSSYILAKTTKMSISDAGTIWRLEWSPVVTGIGDSGVRVTYQIYRGTGTGSSVEEYMASTDDTTFFLTLQQGDEDYYYVIKALVTKDGQDIYPGIRIQSQKIYVKESEVPSTPAVPELVPEFRNAGEIIISYEDELKSDRAVVLWRIPLRGSGEVDTDVRYDIWLINDPNQLDDPPDGALIASSVKMNQTNFVMSGTKLLGYKYEIRDLIPNSTYYFKIVAKKDYVEFVDNELQYVTLQSDAAMKIIITPASGPIDQPVVPGAPPLRIKKDSSGKDIITNTSAVITLQNAWYEEYSNTPRYGAVPADGARWSWYYRTPGEIDDAGARLIPPVNDLVAALESNYDNDPDNDDASVDLLKFRKVKYDSGVTIDVGCVEYSPDIDYNDLENLPANKIVGFPATPNDPAEDTGAADAVRDGLRHNIDITLTGLEPNKTYIIWVRASRRSVNLISGPSDPIIVTTIPDLPDVIEKPTVPVFNYYHAGDTFIDLAWNFNSSYVYYLEYGTVDDRSKSTGRKEITPDELEFATYYRVSGLKQDTVYYFWIQAEASNASGERKRSEFSDSFIVRTLKDIPPDTPLGFGVKGTADAVTKNSITYEWIPQDGMEYILEIDDDINYTESTKYEISDVSEFTVPNLRSNFRYYARLYAYDPAKDLHSAPTQSVVVRTLRSSDDYDSDSDTGAVITGDYIIKDKAAVNGVWNIRITGINADRFIQRVQTDNVLDYSIDLRQPPTGTRTISVRVAQKVFEALGMLGENLILKTGSNMFIIRPGVLTGTNGTYGQGQTGDFVIEITPQSTIEGTVSNLTFKTPVSNVDVGIIDGLTFYIAKFLRPLKVVYEYSQAGWYKPGTTFGYYLPKGTGIWQKTVASGSFDPDGGKGLLAFEMPIPGKMAAADQGLGFYDDISRSYAAKAIGNVAAAHELKSVKGSSFEPAKDLTLGDGVKFMLDVMDTDYGQDYMTLAAKAGIIKSTDTGKSASNCTREQLISMAMRICELKTSQKAASDTADISVYKDISQVSPALLPRLRFAQENGLITSRFSDTLGPKDVVTRAEAMVLLEKVLRYAGEI
jgi:hypothetical protein